VLRDRFVLEEVIGTGGMSVVFRALDRRREEAQDRHPHVAIKVLGDEFKRHPDALRANANRARRNDWRIRTSPAFMTTATDPTSTWSWSCSLASRSTH
jgi:serine/threonine protein kinase